MTRTGFVVLSLGVLLGLPLLYAASLMLFGSMQLAAAPLWIVLAGVAMGVVTMLRARAARLSGLWGFLAMIVTVQALALVGSILVGGPTSPGSPSPDPLAAAIGSPAAWLLVVFVVFLLLEPEWAGPRTLDIGLSAVAAFAAIIVVAVGYAMHLDPATPATGAEHVVTTTLDAVPFVDWLALGVFVTALTGIIAGRMLPEAME